MSRSPKYSAVRAGEERQLRLERERRDREQRRRREEAARAKASLASARAAAHHHLNEAAARYRTGPMVPVVEHVRADIDSADTPAAISEAVRRFEEISGTPRHLAQNAVQRRAAAVLVQEVDARLTGLVNDATEADVMLQELTLAGEALQLIRAEFSADRPAVALELAIQLAARLHDIERELDSAIERISARREMLGSIAEALPSLGFAVELDSLRERADGSIGIRARRRTGEALAVVVEDAKRDEYRVNYLRGTATAVLDRDSCVSFASLAENLNDSVRGNGFDTSPVTWEGDDGVRPPAFGTHRSGRSRQQDSYRSEES
jgi:hypothetical protein